MDHFPPDTDYDTEDTDYDGGASESSEQMDDDIDSKSVSASDESMSTETGQYTASLLLNAYSDSTQSKYAATRYACNQHAEPHGRLRSN